MSIHVQIENTLVEHKMAKNSHMALCCQNQAYKGTVQHYGLHSSASISGHSTHIMVLCLLKKKKKEKMTKKKKESIQNGLFSV